VRPELETYYEIDLFLKGELSGEALRSFEDRLQSDPLFSEEVNLVKQVNFLVMAAASDQLRQQVISDVKKIDQKRISARKYGFGMIVVLTLVSCITLFLYNNKSSRIPRNISISAPVITEVPAKKIPEEKFSEATVSQETSTKPAIKKNSSNTIRAADPEVSASEPAQQMQVKDSLPTIALHAVAPEPLVKTEKKELTAIPRPAKEINSQPDEAVICHGFKIETIPKVEAACPGEASGKVIFNTAAIKGGQGPYHIALEKKSKTSISESFYGLDAGDHLFFISDDRGCTEAFNIIVPERPCGQNKFTLNTTAGETWHIPAVKDEFTITINDRSGRVVYKHKSAEIYQLEWNGTDLSSGFLDPGLYIYLIEYTDGKTESGQISIVK
jgi:hypothetical protein